MKFFLKRLHNKKGFTLIELIVVIAILAILALIAIPRFAGFTDKAKMAADNQYGAILGEAASVLLAEGYFNDDVVITISTISSGDITVSGAAIPASGEPTAVNARLEMLKLIKITPLKYYTAYSVAIDENGDITITSTPAQ